MLSVSINVVYFMLSLALLFAFIRLTRGPSLPDRVVALELITSIVV
ncbi:MAG TPA: pH regulation protein F, partial [Marinobacter adhaerens]|nr:pH regulation protein F [Marinobacter adhaerens]